MKKILQFEEANKHLQPYYEGIKKCLDKCIGDCNLLSDSFSNEQPASFKNRTKGSFIADRLRVHLSNEFANDSNVKFVEIRGALGLIIAEKIVIRFNKMDEKFRVSINKKTRSSKRYLFQLPIEGLEDLTYVWGGYNPDKTWNFIIGYYLTCFNGTLQWQYDMGRNNITQQLGFEIPAANKPTTKRVKPKKSKDNNSDEKTGTND
jgi:hypothetical protein